MVPCLPELGVRALRVDEAGEVGTRLGGALSNMWHIVKKQTSGFEIASQHPGSWWGTLDTGNVK